MIKLIASDVDGTLVKDSSPFIYPELPETVIRLKKEKNIQFTVASGRQYYSIRSMFRSIADDIVYIADNGAHIVYQGKTLYVKEMKRSDAEDLVRLYRQYQDQCELLVSTQAGSLIETDNPEFIELIRNGYRNRYEIVGDVLDTELPIIKVSIYKKGGLRDLGEQIFIPAFADKCKGTMAGEEWVDFMDESVDKGNALHFLEQHLGISREETMAFGDNNNDIGMLQAAGISYAVETAREEVKKVADYICPSYMEKGVYQIIKNLL